MADPAQHADPTAAPQRSAAATLVGRLIAAGQTVATAESLTGGLVSAALTSVPGSSAVVRGGVVSYATDVKASMLGVDPALLAEGGAVQAEVARQMATGVRRALGADWGLATTGVAGPTPQDGHAVGHVFIAIAGPDDVGPDGTGPDDVGPDGTGVLVGELHLSGDRDAIRAQTVAAVLTQLTHRLGEPSA